MSAFIVTCHLPRASEHATALNLSAETSNKNLTVDRRQLPFAFSLSPLRPVLEDLGNQPKKISLHESPTLIPPHSRQHTH